MKMRNLDLIESFVNGATNGQSHTGNLRIAGDLLINYSTVLAIRKDCKILLNSNKYSATTSKIQTYIRRKSGSKLVETTEKGILMEI